MKHFDVHLIVVHDQHGIARRRRGRVRERSGMRPIFNRIHRGSVGISADVARRHLRVETSAQTAADASEGAGGAGAGGVGGGATRGCDASTATFPFHPGRTGVGDGMPLSGRNKASARSMPSLCASANAGPTPAGPTGDPPQCCRTSSPARTSTSTATDVTATCSRIAVTLHADGDAGGATASKDDGTRVEPDTLGFWNA